MRFEKTVKNVVPVMEDGVKLTWTPISEPDCMWYVADQKVIVDDLCHSVIMNGAPSPYDRHDKNMKVFNSRHEAELYCVATGLPTLKSLVDNLH